MVAQVTLGNFFTTASGKTVLGGIGGSGLDSEALIKTLVAAKGIGATQSQDLIKVNDKQSAALTEFQTLLSNFQAAADALRNPPGVGNEGNNAFKFTAGTVTSNTAIPGSAYVSVSSSPGASNQSYTVSEITRLATATRQTSGVFNLATADTVAVSSSTITPATAQFAPGTFTLKGQSITLAQGDTLNNVAAKFNAVQDATGVTVSVVKITGGQYKLSFASTQTGTAANFDLANQNVTSVSDPSSVLAQAGFTSGAGTTTAVAGTDAQFKLDGIALTRSTNSVTDAVSGVTFNLLQQTPDALTQLTVAIKPDTATVQNSIVNFVATYNEIKAFAAVQTQLSSAGTYADTAILANNTTFRSIMSNLNQQVTNQVNGLTGNFTSLSDIGITFTTQPASADQPQVDNILNINDAKLTSALTSNYSDVSKLFGFTMTSNNPNIKLFQQNNSLSVTAFTLNIDPLAGTFQATYMQSGSPVTVNLTASPIGVLGYNLAGQAGTPLEGLQLIYGSTSAGTASVTLSKGVADRTYHTTDGALKLETGSIPVALKSIKDNNTRLNQDITQINERVAQYQQQLLNQFAALERTISQVNSLLTSLAANDSARTANN